MQKTNRIKYILSSIYSGIGLGLLLGLIMGLSISPTVKVVIGALSALLGGLLGLEHKLGKSDHQEHAAHVRNIKLGSFGFAVVAGILFGITVRTHNLFAPTLTEGIQSWVDAGYDSASARKYVLYEKLGIDPITGEIKSESGEIQRANTAALFKSSTNKELSILLDTTFFKSDMLLARNMLKKVGNAALDDLLNAVSEKLPEKDQMAFLVILQQMTYNVEEEGESYCQLPQDTMDWNSELLKKLSNLLIEINYQSRGILVTKTKEFFCTIE